MARQDVVSMFAVALFIGAFASVPTSVQSIGVCYGMMGRKLPNASEVVQMYRSKGITGMRLYSPDAQALSALRNSRIGLILDVGEQLPNRGQPRNRGVLGQKQRPALLPGREHHIHRGRQRGPGRRHAEHRAGHAQPQRGPLRGWSRRHQGVDLDPVRRGGQLLPALRRRVQECLHDGRGPAPGEHRRAAAGQRVPLLRLQARPAEHQAQLRDVPAGSHGAGRQERAELHVPVRRDGGRRVRGARKSRRTGRGGGGVRERVAIGRRRVRGVGGKRAEV